jgi:hypothetical protein
MSLGYGEVDTYGELTYKQDLESTFLTQNKINATTGVCIGYDVKAAQGQGYKFLRNSSVPEAWIWPDPQSDPLEIIDARNNLRYLILDEVTGRFFEVGTRRGPNNSGISEVWMDKVTGNYAGVEIPCGLQLRDHTGRAEHETIEHVETHAYLRPRHRENKGADGYTADGFRPAQEFEIRGYKDGDIAENMRTQDVPLNGDFVFDRNIADAKRFQVGFFTKASDFRLAGMDTYYLLIDESESRRAMTEHGWQDEFATPSIWFCRGPNPLVDRATGEATTGTLFDTVDGPDGKDNSAMRFSGQEGLQPGRFTFSGDFTLIVSFEDIIMPCRVFGPISIFEQDNVRYARLTIGNRNVTNILNWNGTGWATIMFKRTGDNIVFAEDGAVSGTHANVFDNTFTVDMNVMLREAGNVTNAWLFETAISDLAFNYFYTDMVENSGDALLPMW